MGDPLCMSVMESLVPPLHPHLLHYPPPLALTLYSNMERLVGLSRKLLKVWAVPGREDVSKPAMTIPRPALAALSMASFL